MLSSRLVEARPVRTVASLCRKSSITFSILDFVSLLISLTIWSSILLKGLRYGRSDSLLGAVPGAGADDRSHALACNRAFDISSFSHIENENWQTIILAKGDR